MEVDEEELLRQVETIDWQRILKIASASIRSLVHKKIERACLDGWIRGLRSNERAAGEEEDYKKGYYQECGVFPSLQTY